MDIKPELLEPEAARKWDVGDDEGVLLYSIAISVKKIADALNPENVKGLLDIVANHPMNQYGEPFSDALQNALARGKDGITTYGN